MTAPSASALMCKRSLLKSSPAGRKNSDAVSVHSAQFEGLPVVWWNFQVRFVT